jgi:hypothetical protein
VKNCIFGKSGGEDVISGFKISPELVGNAALFVSIVRELSGMFSFAYEEDSGRVSKHLEMTRGRP